MTHPVYNTANICILGTLSCTSIMLHKTNSSQISLHYHIFTSFANPLQAIMIYRIKDKMFGRKYQ